MSKTIKTEKKRKLVEPETPNKKVVVTQESDGQVELTSNPVQYDSEPEDVTPSSILSGGNSSFQIHDLEDDEIEDLTPNVQKRVPTVKPEVTKPSVNSSTSTVVAKIKPETKLEILPSKVLPIKGGSNKVTTPTEEDFDAPPPDNVSLYRLTTQQERLVRTDFENLPTIEAPPTILFPLKFYQKQGVKWMHDQEESKRGGILADEMGLGKTLMTLTTCMLNNKKRNLIVVEKSLIDNWRSEILKFVKDVNVSIYHARSRDKPSILNLCDFTITTYGTLGAEFNNYSSTGKETTLFQIQWNRVILDESHKIKNQKTTVAKACYALKTVYRWCLTGTPIHNELSDLFSYFRFLKYAPYNDEKYFRNYVVAPIQTDPTEGFKTLMEIMYFIMLRRTKNCYIKGEKLIELKEKIFTNVEFDFENEKEAEMYDIVFKKVQDRLFQLLHDDPRAIMKSYMWFLTNILRLKQICDHHFLAMESKKDDILVNCLRCGVVIQDGVVTPCDHYFCDMCIEGRLVVAQTCKICNAPISEERLKPVSSRPVHMQNFVHSSKTKHIMIQLEKILAEDTTSKILIYSQWTSFLDILEIPIKRAKIGFIRVDGKTSLDQRKERFDDFQTRDDGTLRVALLSLRSCGVGLNLVQANHVFMTDLWWNPAVENQAIDRVHRIGQTKQVYVWKFLVKNSIEQKILKIQESKSVLADGVTGVDISEKLDKLSPENLKFMFECESSPFDALRVPV
jgi:SNF2 family DNA or RNA helicase